MISLKIDKCVVSIFYIPANVRYSVIICYNIIVSYGSSSETHVFEVKS